MWRFAFYLSFIFFSLLFDYWIIFSLSLSRSSFLLIIYSIINEIEEEKTNYLILFEQLTPNVLSVYTFRDDDDGNILRDRSSNLLIRRNFFQWFSYSFASIVVRLTPINEPVSMSCEHHQSLFPSSGMKSSSSPVEHLPCVNVIIISSSVTDRREMNSCWRTRAFFFLRLFFISISELVPGVIFCFCLQFCHFDLRRERRRRRRKCVQPCPELVNYH